MNNSFLDLFSDKMAVNVEVFCPFMKYSILKSLSRYKSHCNLVVVEAIALYSASEELLDIVFYFLDFQDISESPMKTV